MTELLLSYYSEKSFALFGIETKTIKEDLKEMGGKFVVRLKSHPGSSQTQPGWIFSMKKFNQMKEYLNENYPGKYSIKTELIVSSPSNSPQKLDAEDAASEEKLTQKPLVPRATPKTPVGKTIKITPTLKIDYQTVTYKVIKPAVGMSARISTIEGVLETKVTEVRINDGVVDMVVVKPVATEQPDETVYHLVITNGQWQVLGLVEEHSVSFSI
jgi:hypothetical protein